MKKFIFFASSLHYIQICNYTLNHDHKFKTMIVFKDVRVPKSKRVYVFFFLECFEHMNPFLWNILKFTKELKQLGVHTFDKEERTLKQKNHLSTCFF